MVLLIGRFEKFPSWGQVRNCFEEEKKTAGSSVLRSYHAPFSTGLVSSQASPPAIYARSERNIDRPWEQTNCRSALATLNPLPFPTIPPIAPSVRSISPSVCPTSLSVRPSVWHI